MTTDILKFFTIHRQIFGICPRSGQFFRLSDCKVFIRKRPVADWLDRMELKNERLDRVEERLEEREEEVREKAREKGRRLAQIAVKKIDCVFSPHKLNADDAKVLFHPIDYIIFNGMKGSNSIKNIILLDREADEVNRRNVQKSIERVIEQENYEWQTLRVQEDGKIKTE